jgi:hypothetical protein
VADKISKDWQHLKANAKGELEEVKDTRNYPSMPKKEKPWREKHPLRAKAVDAYLSIGEAILPNSYKKGK